MKMILKNFLIVLSVVALGVADEGQDAQCNCGVFRSPTPATTSDAPLIMKSPNFAIECNSAGKETCSKMCVALAEAAKDKAPKVLCETLGNMPQPFTPLVYSKACGEKTWTDTGLTSKFHVCCENKSPIACPGTAATGSEPAKN